jgi:hypothetical protein
MKLTRDSPVLFFRVSLRGSDKGIQRWVRIQQNQKAHSEQSITNCISHLSYRSGQVLSEPLFRRFRHFVCEGLGVDDHNFCAYVISSTRRLGRSKRIQHTHQVELIYLSILLRQKVEALHWVLSVNLINVTQERDGRGLRDWCSHLQQR